MTALTASVKRDERLGGKGFGYAVAPNFRIFAGGLVGVNAAGLLQPAGTAGVVAIVGIAMRDTDNTAGDQNDRVGVSRGTWQFVVTAAVFANIGAAVYATDDQTGQLGNGGGQLAVGTLAAIEAGVTFVRI